MAKPRRRDNGEASIQRAEFVEEAESMYRAPQSAGDTTVADVDRERVAQRAYELYLERGRVDGQAMEDWLNAERELIRGE
jgi:outer membrane protein TolC